MDDVSVVNALINSQNVFQSLLTISFIFGYHIITKIANYYESKNSNSVKNTLITINNTLIEVKATMEYFKSSLDKIWEQQERGATAHNEKCKIVVGLAFSALEKNLFSFATTTIINNNIDVNADNIKANIVAFVDTEYHNTFYNLHLYELNGVSISAQMEEKWKDILISNITNIVFMKDVKSLDKITILKNKLTLLINGFCSKTLNKISK